MSNNAQLNTVETYARLMNINGTSHVLRTVVRLGIVDALMSGQKTAIQLSEICKLKHDPLELLMAAAVETGLIEKYGDDYALSYVGKMLPQHYRDLGDRYWQYLENFVRTGQRIPDDKEIPQEDADYLAEVASAEWVVTPSVLAAIDILDIPTSRYGMHVLEIGAGAAVFGMAILHRDPSAHLTALDTQRNLERTKVTANSIDKNEAVDYIEGDYRAVDFPADRFEMVVVENLLHLHSIAEVKELLTRIRTTLRKDGELVIMDVFPGQNGGKVTRELFELSLQMRFSAGTLHTPDELKSALGECGFPDVTFAHLDTPPCIYGMIVAK